MAENVELSTADSGRRTRVRGLWLVALPLAPAFSATGDPGYSKLTVQAIGLLGINRLSVKIPLRRGTVLESDFLRLLLAAAKYGALCLTVMRNTPTLPLEGKELRLW